MQLVIVAIAVSLATLVSAWKLMPARRRLQLLVWFDGLLARHHWMPGFRDRILRRRVQAAGGSGCAGCAANVGTRPKHPAR